MPETIEHEPQEQTALVVAQPATTLVEWTPRFAVAVDEAIGRKAEKRRFFESVMDEGLHYGVIPGTKTKPTLLKPGAEMLLSNMGLTEELSDAEPPVRDYDGTGAGNGEPLILYRRVCRIYRQTGPLEHERMLVAKAEGFCTSREEKYRYRSSSRACPSCGGSFIIKGKAEYGGGWLCFKKKGGCGAKFDDGDPAIESQGEGKVLNPNIADVENTVLKMADKRALVAATLLATGCSDIFTQDAPDEGVEGLEPPQSVPSTVGRAAHAQQSPAAAGSNPGPAPRAAQAREPAPQMRDMQDGENHDPVQKGAALDAIAKLRRERFISPALFQALLKELWPDHASAKTGFVSEGDLSVEKLRSTWAELNKRTKPEKKVEPVAAAPVIPADDGGGSLFDGELAL